MAQCRFCSLRLEYEVIDLGVSPLSNSYITPEKYMAMEPCFPLLVYFCDQCGLVQLEEFAAPETIFGDYDYFSSYSESWLRHARDYVSAMTKKYALNQNSQVVEVASNDGYLLQYFVKQGVKVLGIEPAANVAQVARERGVTTETVFFGQKTAEGLSRRGFGADLLVANNVLAHVPDINDFVAGFAAMLKPNGVLTVEFPHLLNMIRLTQFDTIYHEHFSYLSLHTVRQIFAAHGLTVFNVEELPTHGGSLRVYASLKGAGRKEEISVAAILAKESAAHLDVRQGYDGFAEKSYAIKNDLLEFLLRAVRDGKRVTAYGAAAKGNTLLNFAGIRRDLVTMVADRNPGKQGKFLPGSRIPVVPPDQLVAAQPDYIIILPWNLKDEIAEQLSPQLGERTELVTAIPELRVWR
ncbi:MAG: class I SAM-dependent methyltransferase [Planctomycetaceae bacterium]|nr:class I SAM-dependent methyltransferase [Planctomycetaceae bacterium]